jgi:protein-tyrosine phosphatase
MVWPGERALTGGVDRIPLSTPGGALWLCGKRFVGPDPEAALAQTATTTVVCLCESHELSSRYPAYVTWLRSNQPARALWFPVADLDGPPLAEGRSALADLGQRVGQGERLLMHCGAGIGRAGTMATGLLITLGADPAAAAALVAAHRPMAGPQSSAQVDFLAALAARHGLP